LACDARIAAIDVEADAADLALAGKAARELRPGLAPVRRLPEPAAGAAAVVAEGRAPPLVRRRVEGLRALRVHGHVHEAGVLVDELRVDPGLAAVRRAEEAALLVRSPEMAQGGDVHDVRVGGVHDDAADVVRVREPQVDPRLARVE
jgi:hypothetical protein